MTPVAGRRRLRRLEVHHRAGQGARDTTYGLDPGHDQSAQSVKVTGLRAHDDVIGPGQRLGLLHAVDLRGGAGDQPSLADLGLDEDIGGDHLARLPNLVAPGAGWDAGLRWSASAEVCDRLATANDIKEVRPFR